MIRPSLPLYVPLLLIGTATFACSSNESATQNGTDGASSGGHVGTGGGGTGGASGGDGSASGGTAADGNNATGGSAAGGKGGAGSSGTAEADGAAGAGGRTGADAGTGGGAGGTAGRSSSTPLAGAGGVGGRTGIDAGTGTGASAAGGNNAIGGSAAGGAAGVGGITGVGGSTAPGGAGGQPPTGADIWWVSRQGKDSYDGRSIATAFATFHKALTSMVAGDTLYIDDGVYSDTIGASNGSFSPWSTDEGKNGQSSSKRTRILGYRPHAVTVDGGGSRYPLFIFKGQHIEVGNIVFLHSAAGYEPVHVEESDDIYLHQLGAAYPDPKCDNCTAVDSESSSNITIEECWTWGFGARYGIALHGGLQNVARRTVTRYDGSVDGNPKAGLVLYSEDQSVAENNITLDFDVGTDGTGDVHAAFFTTSSVQLTPPAFPPGLPRGLGSVSWYGNMAINTVSTSESIMFFDSLSSVGGTITAIDNVIANGNAPFQSKGNSNGIWVSNDQGTPHSKISLSHNTVYNVKGTGVRVDAPPEWKAVEFNDNLISNLSPASSPCFQDVSGSGTRIVASNNEVFGCSPLEIPNDATLSKENPQLSYLLRTETGTPGNGSGTAGTNRGATVIKRYVNGTLTDTSLWPFPNEDFIKQDLCAGPDGTLLNGEAINTRGHNASGWCASNKTLTKYVWEQLGNTSPF